jgi:hypothetical protein
MYIQSLFINNNFPKKIYYFLNNLESQLIHNSNILAPVFESYIFFKF